jgi:hypothetical protein
MDCVPMPRRPRDDLQPLVQIKPHPRQAHARDRLSGELEADDELIVRKRFRPNNSDDKYFTIHDDVLETYERFAIARNLNAKNTTRFNYDIFFKLWRHVQMSKVSLIDSSEHLYRMLTVGCRVMHDGIADLAKRIDVSISTLEKQIALYRDIGLVVNVAKALSKRRGFIEFDVMVGWRGKLDHRLAYAAQKTGMIIRTPSPSTLIK